MGLEYWSGALYLAGGIGRIDAAGTDIDLLNVRVGLMLQPALRLAAGVDRSDPDAPGASASNDVVFEAKYVADLGMGSWLNLEGTLSLLDDPIDETRFTAAADYYFSPRFSAGAGVSLQDNDNNVLVRSQYFFTPNFAGSVSYETQDDGDTDTLRIGAVLRF